MEFDEAQIGERWRPILGGGLGLRGDLGVACVHSRKSRTAPYTELKMNTQFLTLHRLTLGVSCNTWAFTAFKFVISPHTVSCWCGRIDGPKCVCIFRWMMGSLLTPITTHHRTTLYLIKPPTPPRRGATAQLSSARASQLFEKTLSHAKTLGWWAIGWQKPQRLTCSQEPRASETSQVQPLKCRTILSHQI